MKAISFTFSATMLVITIVATIYGTIAEQPTWYLITGIVGTVAWVMATVAAAYNWKKSSSL
jgi:hypothetical protein